MSISSFDHLFFFIILFRITTYSSMIACGHGRISGRCFSRSRWCCCQPVVVVAFDVAGNLVIVVKFTLQSVFSNPHQNPRHASERSRRIHSSCILSFDLIGRHKNKRPNVTEIILLLGFADVTFLVERSEDRKNVCVRRLI